LPAILGLEKIDCFQTDVSRGLSCIAKYRFPNKLGMTGDEKEIGSNTRRQNQIYFTKNNKNSKTYINFIIIATIQPLKPTK